MRIGADSVADIAETIPGLHTPLDADVAINVASDVEYRIRQIVQAR